jgi:methylated-DNA-[protein]-cysteine S-methyltransferase
MQNLFKAYYRSPIGILEVESSDTSVSVVSFVEREGESSKDAPPVLLQCLAELDEYFTGKRKDFSVSLDQYGTEFQKKVWNELLDIPFGKTTSYLNIAKKLSNAKSIRAVGGANGKNKIAIIVPCHRVIGNNFELVGYAGGKWRKQWLLEHEGAINIGQKTLF